MIQLAVFDLDGTLADSLTDLALCVNSGLLRAGLPEHPIEQYNRFVGNGRDMLIRRAIGPDGTDAQFACVLHTFDEEYCRRCNDHTVAYDGCAAMLQTLVENGIQTAVLSNKPDEFMSPILHKLYPTHHFLEAWGQKAPYKCKPDRGALDAMLAHHGITQDSCIYVGDSDVDVFTAANAGVRMAGVSWGFRGRAELLAAGAPFVADTAAELAEYIMSL